MVSRNNRPAKRTLQNPSPQILIGRNPRPPGTKSVAVGFDTFGGKNMKRTPQVFAEVLEGRTLLAATAVLNSRGIFKVTGTDAAETIDIALNSAGDKVQATLGGTLLGEATL